MLPKKILAICAILALVIGAIPVAVAEENNGIVIEDSRGMITELSGPATHVAAFGAFATMTLVDVGALDKAVILDASSAYDKSGIVEVKDYPADKFITISSTNKDLIVQKMLKLVDDGIWNKTTDVVLGYGYGYLGTVWTALEGNGFHVVTFYPNSYDGVVKVVADIETIVGVGHGISQQMAYVKTYIGNELIEKGIDTPAEKVGAVYASYSSNTLKLGNGGSITVDFINFAGGYNKANDTSKATPTYPADFSAILQLDPEYVLLDGYYTGTAQDFSNLIGNSDIIVYKLNKTWNSYCPDAMVGLWTIACLFYPQYFNGAVPTIPVTPEAPLDLSAIASDGYVTLTWNAPMDDGGADIDYYVVFVDGVQNRTTTTTFANVTGLTNGQTYSFMVAAHNSVGLGDNSTSVNASPSPAITVPGAPFGLLATVGDGYVNLTWNSPVNNGGAEVDHYVIYIDGEQNTTTSDIFVNITGLTNGQTYSFMVAAHNSVGLGDNSTSIDAIPIEPADDGSNDGLDDSTLYIGFGIGVVALAGVVVFMMRKR